MRGSRKFLAFDIGASTGRAVVDIFNKRKLVLDEVHRFPNESIKVCGSIHWDVLRLFFEIKKGLSLFVKKYGDNLELDGIGIVDRGKSRGIYCPYPFLPLPIILRMREIGQKRRRR